MFRTQVISMTKSEARRATIKNHLDIYGLPFQFFDALDGGLSGGAWTHFTCRPDRSGKDYAFREREVSHNELACTLSHMQAIQTAWFDGQRETLLVLEDDAMFCTTDTTILKLVASHAPADAAYIQLALTPANTITKLGEHYERQGNLFLPKDSPITIRANNEILGCHCTAGYLITEIGMRSISEIWFDGPSVIFPCEESSVVHNVDLVADRFLYEAATSLGGRGYVCTVPIVTTTANESTLHPDHVIWHEEARDTGLGWFSRLHPMLIERLANYGLGESAQ